MVSTVDSFCIYNLLFVIPLIGLLLCILFLASIGQSLGIRRLYVKLLLAIFEYGRKDIESVQKAKRKRSEDEVDEGYSEPASNDEKVAEHGKNGGNHLISRDIILVPELVPSKRKIEASNGDSKEEEKIVFNLKAWLPLLDYTKSGMESIIEDEVTSRFEAEELKNWNFLTRTNQSYEFISWRLTALWLIGFVVRYFLLLPLRLSIFVSGLTWLLVTTTVIGYLPNGTMKRWLNYRSYVIAFRILTRCLSAVITIHDKQWRPQRGSICVANHTSPIDCIILSTDNCYSLIGQSQGGILGVLQRALIRASPHIWFERSEARDRGLVLQRLREHTSNPKNPPMLIFPEGTCINNTSVMQFKKGSFEVGCPVYPVAIKYDPRFGDAFWNSSRYSMGHYLFMMMTSWAIVCDVWYLPPVHQEDNENSIDYANRVKRLIAQKGGLVDLIWDGQLKRSKPRKEWKEKQQEQFSKMWKAE